MKRSALLFLILAQPVLAAVPASAQPRIAEEVWNALASRSRERIIVVFEGPDRRPGDASRPTSPAVREAIAAARERLLAALPEGDFALRRDFQAVPAVAGHITRPGLEILSRLPQVARVGLDAGGRGQLVEAVAFAELDAVHGLGFTGAGTKVAILDTGYDSDHDDLSDDLVVEQCFCSDNGSGCCPDGSTSQSGPGAAEDDNGHGSHVAGIVTGRGTVAGVGGAPDAGIVAVKVLDSNLAFCCTSDIVAGLDWIAVNHPDVAAVNMSLGTGSSFAGDCDDADAFTMAFATAIENLRGLGVAVFAASGNSASGALMPAPACVRNTISVGAVYDQDVGEKVFGSLCTDAATAPDQVTCFSNSNAVTDLFAPGAEVVSTIPGGGTFSLSGTSQASPMAAACAALLHQALPGLSPDLLESALEGSPVQVTDSKNDLSFPRLDCQAALRRIRSDAAPQAVPAVAEWGLVVLAVFLSVAATILFRK